MADTEPKFVNTLAVHGFVNGVCNLAFSQARWYPEKGKNEEGDITMIVALDEPIVVDLRMDLRCAQQVYAALGKILEENTKGTVD